MRLLVEAVGGHVQKLRPRRRHTKPATDATDAGLADDAVASAAAVASIDTAAAVQDAQLTDVQASERCLLCRL